MTEWIIHPVIVVAVLSVAGLIFAAGQWVGRVNSHVSGVCALLKDIRSDIKQILSRLPPVAVAGDSPLRLTDMGKSVSKTLDAKRRAGQVASTLTERPGDEPPYEIQDFCFRYVKQEFKPNPEQDDRLRMCAYEYGMELDTVLDVLAIELRDALLRNQRRAKLRSRLKITEADISGAVAWARLDM